MKQIIYSIALSFFSIFMYGQCTSNFNNSQINTLKLEITRGINPLAKYSILQDRTKNYCLYSYQVKELIVLLDNDNDKFNFAKNIYGNTIDKENFYDIYDVFVYPSNMFRLNDFIRFSSTHSSPPTTSIPPVTTTPITFPDARFYTGSKGCSNPANTIEFQNIINTIQVQIADIAKYNTAKALINTSCISVEQLMKIGLLIDNESYRLDILKSKIAGTYDRANFSYAAQILNLEIYRNDFMNYCLTISNPTPPTNTVPAPIDSFSYCSVNPTEFTEMKTSIQKLSFSSTKVSQVKTIMNTRCFTANQIKELMKLIDYESGQLDIAKYAYDKCIDKKNYFSINDVFSYSSSINELNNYINNH